MLYNTLLLEVGAEACRELSEEELSVILATYTDAQPKLAGLAVFDILRKKYQPNYRMGKAYEALSDKYVAYDRLYKEYASIIAAGASSEEVEKEKIAKPIERAKFVNQ